MEAVPEWWPRRPPNVLCVGVFQWVDRVPDARYQKRPLTRLAIHFGGRRDTEQKTYAQLNGCIER